MHPDFYQDFFASPLGSAAQSEILSPRRARAKDILFDARLRASYRYWRAIVGASLRSPVRVLVVAVVVAERASGLADVLKRLSSRHHEVTIATAPFAGRGKFDNINTALQGHQLDRYNWIIVVDDDVLLPREFLSRFLFLADKHDLRLAQPAHRFWSFASYQLTQRHWATLARWTGFVEIGPLTALHRDTFAVLLPFPSLQWAWGLDVCWADIAKQHRWNIGVVDATPIRHYRPVATSYSADAAIAEARQFLREAGIASSRQELLRTFREFKA